MRYLLIRHAKTDANRLTRVTFGAAGAPLNEVGKSQARALYKALLERGVDPTTEPVAVSELLRAKQTAETAGFQHVAINSLLNEINTNNPKRTPELLAQGKVPKQAQTAAQAILASPPKERAWVTHGLVIIAVLLELGLSDPDKFIPDYCEIREITL